VTGLHGYTWDRRFLSLEKAAPELRTIHSYSQLPMTMKGAQK
jgi:hypothetical protein